MLLSQNFILMNMFYILNISSWFFFISACFYLSCFLNSYSTFMAVMPSFTSSGSQIYLFYILFCIALLFAFCLQYSQPKYWYLWLSFLVFFCFVFCLEILVSYCLFPHLHLCLPLPRCFVVLSNQTLELKGHRKWPASCSSQSNHWMNQVHGSGPHASAVSILPFTSQVWIIM